MDGSNGGLDGLEGGDVKLDDAGGIEECKGGEKTLSSTSSFGGNEGKLLSLNELAWRLDDSYVPGDIVEFTKEADALAR